MTLICYYFCDKATGLLVNREKIMRILKILIGFGSLTIFVGGLIQIILDGNVDKEKLEK
jgi:hypothetical protein